VKHECWQQGRIERLERDIQAARAASRETLHRIECRQHDIIEELSRLYRIMVGVMQVVKNNPRKSTSKRR
jgi:hypothetical protein